MGYTDNSYNIPSRITRLGLIAFCSDFKRINGWFCGSIRCKAFNYILDSICHRCLNDRPSDLIQAVLTELIHRSDGIFERSEEIVEDKTLMFARFFQEEKEKVKQMNDEELRVNIEELASIAFEAKARLTANDDEKRERSAKATREKREWTISTDANFDTASAIKAVNARKARQSKGDKLLSDMQKLLGVDGANAVLSQASKQGGQSIPSSEKSVNPVLSNRMTKASEIVLCELCRVERHLECPGSFRDDKGSHTCMCSCHRAPSEPVDMNNLDNLFAKPQSIEPIKTIETSELKSLDDELGNLFK